MPLARSERSGAGLFVATGRCKIEGWTLPRFHIVRLRWHGSALRHAAWAHAIAHKTALP
jgi:hypothetical protein